MSTASSDYDIIVLGGGVAGLLIASQLASSHSILVVERSRSIRSTKYWLTDRASLLANPELADAVDTTYSTLDFISYDDALYRCQGDYVLWDTGRLLSALASRILRCGGTIKTNSCFYGYKLDAERIQVMVEDRRLTAKLAIDCMGNASPIIYAKDIVTIDGYYILHGATFRARGHIHPVGLHNLMLSRSPGYIEVFPTSDGRAHVVLIKAASALRRQDSLQEEFDFVISRSPYRHCFESPNSRQFLGGIIPVGKIRRRALDRIVFFGEAGQSNPAATATALTRMLQSYKSVARNLASRLSEKALSAKDLAPATADASNFDRRMHRAIFNDILDWNSDSFSRLVKEMIRADNHDLVNGIMFGYIGGGQVERLRHGLQLASRGSFGILRYLLRGVT